MAVLPQGIADSTPADVMKKTGYWGCLRLSIMHTSGFLLDTMIDRDNAQAYRHCSTASTCWFSVLRWSPASTSQRPLGETDAHEIIVCTSGKSTHFAENADEAKEPFSWARLPLVIAPDAWLDSKSATLMVMENPTSIGMFCTACCRDEQTCQQKGSNEAKSCDELCHL
jgi:hypothetical protein